MKLWSSASEHLDRLTAPGELVENLPGGDVRCYACAHRCLIHPGRRGICQVRFNQDGVLRVPWGYVAGAQVDPVEKKPFNHLLPGSDALTFGMLGCDFHCVLLPELAHLPGPARPGIRLQRPARSRRSHPRRSQAMRSSPAARWWFPLTTNR